MLVAPFLFEADWHQSVIAALQVAHNQIACQHRLCGLIAAVCNTLQAEPSNFEADGTEDGELGCAGFTPYSVEECGYRPGYKQALTSRTINQVCDTLPDCLVISKHKHV